MSDRSVASEPAEARDLAAAGLVYLESTALVITRRRCGRGFLYHDAEGRRITDPETLQRIRSLAIPPAYQEVRIAAEERAHLQAVGRDGAGRIQYRYHPDWERVREARKAERLAQLVECLPRVRAAVRRDLAGPGLTRRKAAACAVALIDATHIRVGCEAYVQAHGSHGAATLLKRHVRLRGGRLKLQFRGKGGREIACSLENEGLARALARVARLPGRRLLQYRMPGGAVRTLSAADVNAYLAEVAGAGITAKDLRGLAASAAAAEQLLAVEPPASETALKRQLSAVMRTVAERLANTPAVVRKSYVHEVVVRAFARGSLQRAHRAARPGPFVRRVERMLGRLARSRSRAGG